MLTVPGKGEINNIADAEGTILATRKTSNYANCGMDAEHS